MVAEQTTEPEQPVGAADCPSWCAHPAQGRPGHAHVSDDLTVAADGQPLVARLLQASGDPEVRVLVNDKVATIEQAEAFARALRRLVDQARLAEPGLGFVATLAARSGISSKQMALAAGVDAQKVAAQRAGAQVLSVHDIDSLALAVARLDAENTQTPRA
jgi:hypothetical protein